MATITKAVPTMYSPSHPGEILLEMYLKPMKVTITEAADALGVSRKHVSAIINGRVPVTPDMAMRLAAVFGTEAALWVNLQAQHDLWVVSRKKPPNVKPLRRAA
ncbi:MAG TPA: HigA family addiction module antitoxin [Steroidobacteraceae bacterium]|jgi:addiction module HigA family antidote